MPLMTIADSINALYPIATSVKGEGIPAHLLALAMKARKTGDKKMMGDVLAEIRTQVGRNAVGFKIPDPGSEEFGKKIGQALYKDGTETSEQMGMFLGQYQRDLARPAMEEAISIGAGRGLVKEVHREPTGDSTCPWCVDRCGIWNPYDANAYGVWARHGGCDCNIYIKWAMEDNEDNNLINGNWKFGNEE